MRAALTSLLLVPIVAVVACGDRVRDEAPPVVLADGVVILDAASSAGVTVARDALRVKGAHRIATAVTGEILVGLPAGEANPLGFLRRVVSVATEGDETIVKTEPATLGDVVREGRLSAKLELPPQAPTPTKKGGTISLVDFSGTDLFTKSDQFELEPGKTVGYQAWLRIARGTLDVTPTWDVGAVIKPKGFTLAGLVEEAHVVATAEIVGTLEAEAALHLVSTTTGEDVAKLLAKALYGSPTTVLSERVISLGEIPFGPLRIPVHARMRASVACDLRFSGETSVTYGARATATVTAGARYDGRKIEPVFSHRKEIEVLGPSWTATSEAGLRCALIPELALSLWDLAAGEVVAETYATVYAASTCDGDRRTGELRGEAFGGVTATARAKLDAFGLVKFEKECRLFDLRTPKVAIAASLPTLKDSICQSGPEPPAAPAPAPAEGCFGGKTVDRPTDPGPTDPILDAGVDAGDPGDAEIGDAGDAPDAEETGPVLCGHDVCEIGAPLSPGCDADGQGGACIAAICEKDPYCCTSRWSLSCVERARKGEFGCNPRPCK
jgi:hypothetical protein